MLASIRSRSTGTITFFLSIFALRLLVPLFFVPLSSLSRAFFSDGVESGDLLCYCKKPACILLYLANNLIHPAAGFVQYSRRTPLIGPLGAFSHYRFRGRFIIRAVSSIPFVLPSIIVVLDLWFSLAITGYLNTLLMQPSSHSDKTPIANHHTFKAIILAHGFYNFPIVLSIVAGYWEIGE